MLQNMTLKNLPLLPQHYSFTISCCGSNVCLVLSLLILQWTLVLIFKGPYLFTIPTLYSLQVIGTIMISGIRAFFHLFTVSLFFD